MRDPHPTPMHARKQMYRRADRLSGLRMGTQSRGGSLLAMLQWRTTTSQQQHQRSTARTYMATPKRATPVSCFENRPSGECRDSGSESGSALDCDLSDISAVYDAERPSSANHAG